MRSIRLADAKATIREHLTTLSDGGLTRIVDGARSGIMEYLTCDRCLLGLGQNWGHLEYNQYSCNPAVSEQVVSWEMAELAFFYLGRNGDVLSDREQLSWDQDHRRRVRIVPMVLREIRRRCQDVGTVRGEISVESVKSEIT